MSLLWFLLIGLAAGWLVGSLLPATAGAVVLIWLLRFVKRAPG